MASLFEIHNPKGGPVLIAKYCCELDSTETVIGVFKAGTLHDEYRKKKVEDWCALHGYSSLNVHWDHFYIGSIRGYI